MKTLKKSLALLTPHARKRGLLVLVLVMGLGAFVLIIVSAAYRTLTHYAMNRYIEMRHIHNTLCYTSPSEKR
jgi:ABC-type transport system involved in cytochrome c biogenesis permease component